MTKWILLAALSVAAIFLFQSSASAQTGDPGCLSVSGCSSAPGTGGGSDPSGGPYFTSDPSLFPSDDTWGFSDCADSPFYCPHREAICEANCEQVYENAAFQCSRVEDNWDRNTCFDNAGMSLYSCSAGCH